MSAAVFLAVAELVALLVAREGSPILAVGSFVIDIVPQPFKEFAIATFGEYDKIALLVGPRARRARRRRPIAGLLQFVKPPLGVVALVIAGGLSVAAIVTRAGATPLAALPPIVGTLAGCARVLVAASSRRLRALARRGADGEARRDGERAARRRPTPSARAVDRRMFFRVTAIAGASAVIVGVGARVVNATASSISAVRKALKLPAPRTTVTIPAGAELDIPGISPLFTPNARLLPRRHRADRALDRSRRPGAS